MTKDFFRDLFHEQQALIVNIDRTLNFIRFRSGVERAKIFTPKSQEIVSASELSFVGSLREKKVKY